MTDKDMMAISADELVVLSIFEKLLGHRVDINANEGDYFNQYTGYVLCFDKEYALYYLSRQDIESYFTPEMRVTAVIHKISECEKCRDEEMNVFNMFFEKRSG